LTGAALLFASVLAGWLWHASSLTATFAAGAVFSAVAAAAIATLIERDEKS
jgi:hypothetical protein